MSLDPEYQRAWYAANRDRVLADKREEYKLIAPVKRAYQKKYRTENAAKVRRADRDRWATERKNDPEYRRKNRAKAREWYYANRKRVLADAREKRLLTHYGLTTADYQRMLDGQDGACAICRIPPAENVNLAVDHCHETGIVRGLLCDGCNQAIGRLGDNAASVNRAVRYLAKFEDSMEEAIA
jgi:hypothetical protein